MSVGFTVKYYWYQVGTADFLHSFFSTIAYNLEECKWGSKYPVIMKELYNGTLKNEHINLAIEEVDLIVQQLKKFSPDHVIWDIDDLSKRPPWGDNISSDITDLSNYFVTSDGDDLIVILKHALEKGIEIKSDVNIKNI
ncbi:MAG: immunity 70 family protein [Methanobrevibacter sp.]|uniref:immunity 70 family protein n=1 Tax=Methanobrevibacter sp. TaxID=66852 RepID=UPI0025FD1774|nr:immunity 70 family protein [Methanobrevibacter sp.]MBQ8016988.1 immunity 70 family protein [Methanobrevibacter sp.]